MIATDAVRSGLTEVHQAVSAESVADGITIDIEESRAAMSTDAVLPRRTPAAFGQTVLHAGNAAPARVWVTAGSAAVLFVVAIVLAITLLG